MKRNITLKERKDLCTKMSKIFKQHMKELTTELHEILVDDMTTALQNRINVLIGAQEKRSHQHRPFTKKT